MSTPCSHEVTELLQAWGRGEEAAFNQLVPLVYAQLHHLAHRYMREERPGHILQTTALINEAYLRLVDAKLDNCPDRSSFLGICAHIMRQILVDWARAQQSLKRQGNLHALDLNEALVPGRTVNPDLIVVNEALNDLNSIDPRKAKIVELRFFGGLTVEEIGNTLGVSVGTVARDWKIAKMFLRRQLNG